MAWLIYGVVLVLTFFGVGSNGQSTAGCSFRLSGGGLPEPQPLFIVPNTTQFFVPPARDGIMRVQAGQFIELFCSGSFVAPFTGVRQIFAQCGPNNQFWANDRWLPITSLRCTGQVFHLARRTGRSCGIGGRQTHIEVGFSVLTRFLPIMEICHDEQLESTLYSYFQQSPFNVGFQTSFPRPSFIAGDFFNRRNVDRLYTKVSQMATIGRVLGQQRVAELFDETRDIYLARGHLAAKADFVFGSQQRGTFYFVNAAPQWQRFNAGNWESIESGVRLFVANRNIRADIFTGTFNVLSFPDVNGRPTPLFLDYGANNNGLIPVPALYYKVVIDRASRRGVVFIGVNNPHATAQQIQGEYRICTDVSHRIGWLNLDWRNVLLGASYACDVNEFARIVQHLPQHLVSTTGLLL